jgi:hypothetical protein
MSVSLGKLEALYVFVLSCSDDSGSTSPRRVVSVDLQRCLPYRSPAHARSNCRRVPVCDRMAPIPGDRPWRLWRCERDLVCSKVRFCSKATSHRRCSPLLADDLTARHQPPLNAPCCGPAGDRASNHASAGGAPGRPSRVRRRARRCLLHTSPRPPGCPVAPFTGARAAYVCSDRRR